MEHTKKELIKEYEKKIKRFHILWPLKIWGFLPFYIQKGKIISKNISSTWCIISFLIIWHLSALYTYCNSTASHSFLISTERWIILVTTVLQDSMLIHNLQIDWRYGDIFCNNMIDIDVILGAAETKFMRDIPTREYFIVSILAGAIQALLIIIYCTMWESDWSMKLAAMVIFGFNLLLYILCFCISIILFLAMRVRYLNVALIKLANLNPTYFPKYIFFDGLFWKDEYDDLVNFHNRADCKDFTKIFKIIYLQLRILEKIYQLFDILIRTYSKAMLGRGNSIYNFFIKLMRLFHFRTPALVCIMGLLLITFSALQEFIENLLTPDHFQNIFPTTWAIGAWVFSVGAFIQLDFLYDEVQRSKLICTYILLKDSIPLEIILVADSILKTLSTRNFTATVYGMFEINSGMFLRLAAALIVYITMQLQIALEGVKDITTPITSNITKNEN